MRVLSGARCRTVRVFCELLREYFDMPSATVDLAPFLTSVVSSAVVAAVVTALFRRGENKQLHTQNAVIETLRSDLRQLESRSKTQFDWLHQRKAEAAVQVYGLLVDLKTAAFSHLAANVLFPVTTEAFPAEPDANAHGNAAMRAGEAYRAAYSRLALLLPEAVTAQLEELDVLLLARFQEAVAYEYEQKPKPDLERTDFNPLFDPQWKEIGARIKGLRATLRTVLGDVEKDARAQSGEPS